MSEDRKTPLTALALNNQEIVDSIVKEVQEEFITSDREVFKAGLRSLLVQEQKLLGQISQINSEIEHLHQARDALTEAFKAGTLHSVQDARGVVRKVKRELERDFTNNYNNIDDDFE